MEKVTETVEQVIGYRATDGAFFQNVEECRKYEQSARVAAAFAAKSLIHKQACIEDLSYLLCMGFEDEVTVYDIKTSDDLQILNTHLKMEESSNKLVDSSYIGKRIAIRRYSYDSCTSIMGTRADIEKEIGNMLDKLFKDKGESDAE